MDARLFVERVCDTHVIRSDRFLSALQRKKREMGSRIISETEKAALILGCSHAAEASPSSNASESGAEVSVSIRKENIGEPADRAFLMRTAP